jgi:hypothetical protein
MMGRKQRRGAILALMAVIGVIVAIVGVSMIELGYHARMAAIRNVRAISARCAADAGMVEALYKMQRKLINEAVWDNSSLPVASNVTLNGVTSTYSFGITGNPWPGYRIDSTGTCGSTTRTTHANVYVGSYWEGVGVEKIVQIHAFAQFGVIGPYAYEGLEIQSNTKGRDDMVFFSSVRVPGDVICGPGSNPDYVIETKQNVIIQGEIYAAEEEQIFPDVLPPPNMTYSGTINLGNGQTQSLSAGRYTYNGINLGQDAALHITGDVVLYVPHPYPMILNQGARVVIDPGGSLELYLGTRLEDKNSSGQAADYGLVNDTADATKLKIYGLPTCTDIDLKAKSDLYAAVYAPDSTVTVFNEGNFTGAVTAHDFYMKNSGNFIFDTRLKRTTIDAPEAVFVVGRWWEN